MPNRSNPTPAAGGPRAGAAAVRSLRLAQQGLIDAEMRASRRALLEVFRHRLRAAPETLTAEDFLRLADRPVVLTAIVIAASARADGCVLYTVDPAGGTARIVRHRGVTDAFVEHAGSAASLCGIVLRTGGPVLVDDVAGHPVLAGLDTVTRAVHHYPLYADHGGLLGVLGLHHETPGRRPGQERLAEVAARALAHVTAVAGRDTTIDLVVSRTAGDLVTLTVRGTVDVLTAADLTALAERTIATLAPGQELVIDLSGIDLLAVAGARAVLAAIRHCTARGVRGHVLIDPGHDGARTLLALDAATPLVTALSGRLPSPTPVGEIGVV
ncbi:STAS domain-containing protein [Actinoplanes flavus]|uniref:STAS domain-containing protein n=1 Tax=Actinoplanes flavus TaxID=2820290 RepID=A0ABS3UIR7_9ACTN|nr:STAS domain-containing protein [Actinoplanes flavus]MBO3738673.1 STAS domain-containing protein [Actinoplanes flavus]